VTLAILAALLLSSFVLGVLLMATKLTPTRPRPGGRGGVIDRRRYDPRRIGERTARRRRERRR